MKVNLFFLKKDQIYPMAVNIGEGTNVINLLFITIKNGKNGYRGHYALIKNLDIFLASKTKSKFAEIVQSRRVLTRILIFFFADVICLRFQLN